MVSDIKEAIGYLNKARSMELQAISQYMQQHYTMAEKGLGELAVNLKRIAIDEMGHAEDFAELTKSYGFVPTIMSFGDVVTDENVDQIYDYDVNFEDNTVETYIDLCKDCARIGFREGVDLFNKIIEEERLHLGYFEDIKKQVTNFGKSFLVQFTRDPITLNGIPHFTEWNKLRNWSQK